MIILFNIGDLCQVFSDNGYTIIKLNNSGLRKIYTWEFDDIDKENKILNHIIKKYQTTNNNKFGVFIGDVNKVNHEITNIVRFEKIKKIKENINLCLSKENYFLNIDL